jgi:phosphate-selective porin OprO/OprP
VPNRDIGVQARGDLAAGHVSYIGGVFNGVPDGTNGDVDSNGSKDLAGRLTFKVGGLGVAIAGTSGRQTGALPSFKTAAQQTFFSYGSSATADGMRTRVSPAAFYYYMAFGAFGEYVRSTQSVTKGAIHQDIANSAWEATGLAITTGEKASERGVVPKKPFDLANGQWGALQLAARYASRTKEQVPRTHAAAPKGQSLTLASRIGTYIYGDVGCSAVRMLLLYQDLQGPRAIGPGVRLADSRSTY